MNPAYFVAIALNCANPDVIAMANADAPFAEQKGYGAQVLGRYPAAARIGEDGVHGTPLPNGETLRLGKVKDPQDPSRNAFAFALAPEDPKTSGSWRSELAFPHDIEHGKVYWTALSLYVYDWGDISSREVAMVGVQLHSGDNRRRLPAIFSFNTVGAKRVQMVARASGSPDPSPRDTKTWRYDEQRLHFGRWMDVVIRFKLGQQGFLQAWLDGKEIADHEGPLGFDTPGFKDYLKFGYYNWSRFDSPRKVLVRSPIVVLDPSGDKYKPEDLRRLVGTGCR